MVSEVTNGSQTATLTTEHTLTTQSVEGAFIIVVDAANLVDGEKVTIRVYGKARSADTERLIDEMTVEHGQGRPLIEDIPRATPHHYKATLEQNGGTGRAFPWSLYKL